uniref:Uncharacterized protein n=1 Tax=Tanacetum cinerariifolium TaxID=118510 RepID=A0A6L2KWR6_TANCI|nr:hypothetical protein [Tanacetum cinerariifolium]
MSTPAYVDTETITQANEAQSSRVLVPLLDDPYIAVRQAWLVDIDIELETEKAPSEAEESQPLGSRVPLMSEEFEASAPSDTITIIISDPSHSKEVLGTSELILDTETEDESSDSDAEGEGSKDEGPGLDDEGHGLEDEGPGLEEEEKAAPEGQQQAILVMYTTVDKPLGLGYRVLRRLVVAPVQTPPSPEWSSSSLLVSPSFLIVPSPIALPVATPASTISRLDVLPPTLFKGYDRDLRELYTRLGTVRDEIFLPRENHDLRRQIIKERHERLELTDRVARIERRRESGGE